MHLEFFNQFSLICQTCCFTGHRFNRSLRTNDVMELAIKQKLLAAVCDAIFFNYRHFISGGAIGVDIWSAEIIADLKEKYDLTLEIAVPCINQSERWSLENKRRYERIIGLSDKVTVLSEKSYLPGCMQRRNRYMVDSSNLVIAVYDGVSDGGTKNTIFYAEKRGKKIIKIKPFD